MADLVELVHRDNPDRRKVTGRESVERLAAEGWVPAGTEPLPGSGTHETDIEENTDE